MNKPQIYFNEVLNGIELVFKYKPDAQILTDIKEQGFRWNNKQKKWYAKRTQNRERFVTQYFQYHEKINPSSVVEEGKEEAALRKTFSMEKEKKTNVFASFYDSVGGDQIYKNADVDIVDFRNNFHAAYFEKENAWVAIKNNDETIYVYELDGALENNSVCKKHCLSVEGYSVAMESRSALLYLYNELNIRSVSDLIRAVKTEGYDFKNLRVSTRNEKGIEVFSPFKEVAPLKKLPEKWTKTQLIKAICSGQVYKAVMDYRYTDDYAFDAAYNFNRGKEQSLPWLAKEFVEHWDSKVSEDRSKREGNKCVLNVSGYNESMSLYFDMDCDHKKGAEIRSQETVLLDQKNAEKEKNIISFPDAKIEPYKFYHVVYLVKDNNTNEYRNAEDMVQGANLIDYDEPGKFHGHYEKTVDITEKEIVPDKFYKISDLYHKIPFDLEDRRFVPMGNHTVLVSGQALLENAAEGVVIPFVTEQVHCGNSFKSVKDELQRFVDGTMFWGIDVSKVDYKDSLVRVCEEEERIAQIRHIGEIHQEGTSKMSSLFERINEIEKQRKIDDKGKMSEKKREFERT